MDYEFSMESWLSNCFRFPFPYLSEKWGSSSSQAVLPFAKESMADLCSWVKIGGERVIRNICFISRA